MHILMRLYLVRHAETEHNIARRALSHSDIGLSPRGWEEARRIRDLFSGVPLDLVVRSDMRRTEETARPLLEARPQLAVEVHERYRERDLGDWEGRSISEIDWELPGMRYERIEQFRERVSHGLDDLFSRYPDGSVLLFTHGGNVISALAYYLDLPEYPRNVRCDNASVSLFVVDGPASGDLVSWNGTAHLEDVHAA